MPSLVQEYEILLDFTNDTSEPVTIQLQRDYGRNTNALVMLHPSESVTLILNSGSVYRYAIKTGPNVYKVANVIARSWRDIHCNVSRLFATDVPLRVTNTSFNPVEGVVVDRIWRDHRTCCCND
ncbi:hypothetical protein E1B28_001155 [Marasmius oreades]|uniref:Uncharacterized protein n=1 Tax=Marasmius oreades TaxID=181124 RepID=A0A9P8AF39_9AGAR|nr:uncharacterized protein E1B28_001155 [Marasmius oreades]KAG7099297.1 hypothetical protein E1B28_001155 [Marasmius oreades]